MPLYEYHCLDCDKIMEILIIAGDDTMPQCEKCGSSRLDKQLSAPSSMSGAVKNSLPGAGDTGCCGMSPAKSSCAGPGSCCGRRE